MPACGMFSVASHVYVPPSDVNKGLNLNTNEKWFQITESVSETLIKPSTELHFRTGLAIRCSSTIAKHVRVWLSPAVGVETADRTATLGCGSPVGKHSCVRHI